MESRRKTITVLILVGLMALALLGGVLIALNARNMAGESGLDYALVRSTTCRAPTHHDLILCIPEDML